MANVITSPLAAMPAAMVAGDSLKVDFADAAADYPSSGGNAVAMTLVPVSGGTPVTVSCSGGASAWSLVIAAATSAGWAAGDWRWVLRATNGADVATIDQGQIRVAPNPASAATDSRTHARRVLDAIEATIEGRASKSDLKTTFEDGRSIERLTHTELLKMRDAYAAKVRAEERAARGLGPNRIVVSL